MTVHVKAAPSVSGRLLDPDGTPLAYFIVSCSTKLQLDEKLAYFREETITDAHGDFTIAGLIAGTEYSLYAFVRGAQPRRSFDFDPLTVTGTDRIDLGNLVGKAPPAHSRPTPAETTLVKVGDDAPALELTTLDGRKVRTSG